jgi:lipopolysaccharide export system protein LptC
VHAQLGSSTLEGVGMEADNKKRQLTLQSRVKATYLKPQ